MKPVTINNPTMKVIHKSRRSGKTTELIKLCNESNGYIVCHSRNECFRIAKLAEELNLPVRYPLTYGEFLRGVYHNVDTIFIDNADMLLKMLSKVKIGAITINKED